MYSDDITVNEYDLSHAFEPKRNTAISKCRTILSQCFGLLAIDIFKFSHGYFIGFSVIFLPILYKENAEIIMTLDELTWFGSSCFMSPVGSALGGIVAHRIGTRSLAIISAILFTTCGLLFHWASNPSMLLCAQAIAGLTGEMLKSPSFTYIAEITQPYLRGTLMATSNFSFLTGILTGIVLGNQIYWRNLVLINVVIILVGLFLTFFIPESPYWLACNNRYLEAKLSLAWFRGWTNTKAVEKEFRLILNNLKIVSISNKSFNDESIGREKRHCPSKIIQSITQKSFYIPLMTMSYLFFINDFGGGYTIKIFSMLVFKMIKSPIHEHTASSILVVIPIIGAVSIVLTIHYFGKRTLTFFSLFGSGLFFAIVGVFCFLIEQGHVTQHVYYWIPTIGVFLGILTAALGFDKIVYLLNSEVYPMRFRQLGAGISCFIGSIFLSILNKIFLYLVNKITIAGVFIMFSVVNFIGLITIYFILPETEGKTLKDIEDHYAGVRSFKGIVKENKDTVMQDKKIISNPLIKKV